MHQDTLKGGHRAIAASNGGPRHVIEVEGKMNLKEVKRRDISRIVTSKQLQRLEQCPLYPLGLAFDGPSMIEDGAVEDTVEPLNDGRRRFGLGEVGVSGGNG